MYPNSANENKPLYVCLIFIESTSNNIVKNIKNTILDTQTTNMDDDSVSNISSEHVGESDNEDREYLNAEEYAEDAEEDDLHSSDSFYSGKLNMKIKQNLNT